MMVSFTSILIGIAAIAWITSGSSSRSYERRKDGLGALRSLILWSIEQLPDLEIQIQNNEDEISNLKETVEQLGLDLNSLEDALDTLSSETNKSLATLQSNLNTLTSNLNSASIIPPYLALNWAVCIGRESGISGTNLTTNVSDLRCPSGSLPSTNGNNDISGCGLLGCQTDVVTIEECEALCAEQRGDCRGYNWSPPGGNSGVSATEPVCAIYDKAIPDSLVGGHIVLLWCSFVGQPCEIGEFKAFARDIDELPEGFVFANGDTISSIDYTDACDIFGPLFGEDSMAMTCNLPDARNKFIAGAGDIYSLGMSGGSDTLSV